MNAYVLRRIAISVPTVLGVTVLIFLVMRVLPGDPLVAIFGPEGFTKLTAEQRQGVPHHLLDVWDVRQPANVAFAGLRKFDGTPLRSMILPAPTVAPTLTQRWPLCRIRNHSGTHVRS